MKPLDLCPSLLLAAVSAASTLSTSPEAGGATPSPLAAFAPITGTTAPVPLPANYTLLPDLPMVVNGTPQYSSLPAMTFLGNATATSAALYPANTSIPFSNSTIPLAKNDTGHLLDTRAGGDFWMASIAHGSMPYAPSGYPWFRNVMDYGAKGDGTTDDTAAINAAAGAGGRCVPPCNSTSVLGAIVYFPAGTYLVSEPIFQHYYTQFIGDPNNLPTIKGSSSFSGIALIDTDYYIPGESGAEWYQNQNQFLRQIRNFNFDLTEMKLTNPQLPPTGIHWQVAQSTSLQNLNFNMPQGGGNGAVGIFTENGSGGFMSDLTFFGGSIAMRIGSQQFTVRNIKVTSTITAIKHIWDWAFTWKGLNLFSCYVGIDVRSVGSSGPDTQPTASIVVLDSVFKSVGVAVLSHNQTQVVLDNVDFESVTYAIQTDGGVVLYEAPSGVTESFALGTVCTNVTGSCEMYSGPLSPAPSKVPGLLDGSGNFFVQSKPQYQSLSSSNFLSVTSHGAVGDGQTDDTAAINAALQAGASAGQVVFFPMGVYIVTGTILIPAGSKVVGDGWPQIMASGSFFEDASKPGVMVQVGKPGDVGSVEISDMLWTVRGPTAGAVLMEWNIRESSQGSAAMWDCHFRVGGAVGSNLQAVNCPPTLGSANPDCIAASLLLHLRNSSSGYFENVWAWTADHDMDIAAQTMVDVYSARGILVESSGPNWFYGSASEHHVLYQYQLSGANDTFFGFMQTETPYYQSTPPAPEPFSSSLTFPNDPLFNNCGTSSTTCAMAWALRIIQSFNIYIYGAGLYSWFQQYSQLCLTSESCQDALVQTSFSQGLWIYDLVTKGTVEVISPEGGMAVSQTNTQAYYLATIMAYLGLALEGADLGGTAALGTIYRSPIGSVVQSIPGCTAQLDPSATFTLTSACVAPITNYPVSGNGNFPQGPATCETACDLLRLITQTCCGEGGTIANPVVVQSGVPLPAQLTLPAGFKPSTTFQDHNGTQHGAGIALPSPVTIDAGTTFSSPFTLPANVSFGMSGNTPSYEHGTPNGVGVVPLPCTTVPLSSTFTMSAACTAGVSALPAGTENNKPPGPSNCMGSCSLLRRLTGTCCGSGGTLLDPIVIPVGVALPFAMSLPAGFLLPFAITVGGVTYPVGALAAALLIPAGTTLSSSQPFIIPAGTGLVDDEDDEGGEPNAQTVSVEAIYAPTYNPTVATAEAFAIAMMLAVNGDASVTAAPTPSASNVVASPGTATPASTSAPILECYAGTSSGQHAFDGPAALDYVDQFCQDFTSKGATYAIDMSFDNGGDVVEFAVYLPCSYPQAFVECSYIMASLINDCDQGSPVKHGGLVSYSCAIFSISGSSGTYPVASTSSAVTSSAPGATTVVDPLTCYDQGAASSFDGPQAYNEVSGFCNAIGSSTSTLYYEDFTFDNGGNTVTFTASVECPINDADRDACVLVMQGILNDCSPGTSIKYGGSQAHGCVTYNIYGQSGSYNGVSSDGGGGGGGGGSTSGGNSNIKLSISSCKYCYSEEVWNTCAHDFYVHWGDNNEGGCGDSSITTEDDFCSLSSLSISTPHGSGSWSASNCNAGTNEVMGSINAGGNVYTCYRANDAAFSYDCTYAYECVVYASCYGPQ